MIGSMPSRPASGRPRPVAAPVVATLGERPDELAHRWLIALLEARPLDQAAGVPVAEVAATGPALCRAVLDAVGSDAALDELAGSPHPATLARLDDGRGGPALVTAAEALRRAISEAAAEEIPRADTDLLASLTDRLAHVCAHLAATAMSVAHATAHPPTRSARAPAREEQAPRPHPGPPAEEAAPAGAAPVDLAAARREAPGPEGPAPLWLAALERHLSEGGRFGLLLVELDGADRLWQVEGEEAARDLFARAGRAARSALRRNDLLAHEQDGRLWVIAPDVGRSGASALATRVAAAIELAASSRGAPLTASVGVALYPDDGRDTASLTGQAEESALAARAAGVRVVGGHSGSPGPRLVN